MRCFLARSLCFPLQCPSCDYLMQTWATLRVEAPERIGHWRRRRPYLLDWSRRARVSFRFDRRIGKLRSKCPRLAPSETVRTTLWREIRLLLQMQLKRFRSVRVAASSYFSPFE